MHENGMCLLEVKNNNKNQKGKKFVGQIPPAMCAAYVKPVVTTKIVNEIALHEQ